MAETYCGKSCAECAQKETMNCPGCKLGPGRTFGGSCELAQCARGKGHETCESCIFRGNCGLLRGKENMPDVLNRKAQAEQARKDLIARRAPVLGKWLWILFWLIIPNVIGGLAANESMASVFPGAYFAGQIVKAGVTGAYGFILLMMASQEERYRKAGIYGMITAAVSLGLALITGEGSAPAWTLVITLPAAVLALIGEYNEYKGHEAVLVGVDNELSAKWEGLWKWYIGCYAGMIGGIFLMVIVVLLGALVTLGAAVGTIVVGILKLVYLYRTAKVFREYQA